MGWGYSYYSTPSVGEQRKQAEKRLAKLRKKDPDIQPIVIEGNKIAKSWWGIAWNRNLERYADYSNRIGRGRSYVKNGLVLDLRVSDGGINAQVSGSSIYRVTVKIDKFPAAKWAKITEHCMKRIGSISALAGGEFPGELTEIFMQQGDGLFPAPKEIHFDCSCPDSARMCKHVAAALYAIGAKFDYDPLLFFKLRGIDPAELIKKSVDEKMKSLLANAEKPSERVIDDADVEKLFGLAE